MEVPTPERTRDLIALAIQDEIRARDTYAAWADRTNDPDVRAMLTKLAEEEESHRCVLETMRRYLAPLKLISKTPQPPPPLPPWAHAEITGEPRDVRELLIWAVRDEQAAQERYRAMASVAPSEKMRDACDSLVVDEGRHQRRLEEQFEKLFG